MPFVAKEVSPHSRQNVQLCRTEIDNSVEACAATAVKLKEWEREAGPLPVSVQLETLALATAALPAAISFAERALTVPLALGSGFWMVRLNVAALLLPPELPGKLPHPTTTDNSKTYKTNFLAITSSDFTEKFWKMLGGLLAKPQIHLCTLIFGVLMENRFPLFFGFGEFFKGIM